MIERAKHVTRDYDRLGFSRLIVHGDIASGRFGASAVLQHYNTVTREVDPEEIRFHRDEVLRLAEQRAAEGKPALLNAVQAILVALDEMLDEKDVQEPEPDPE